MKKQAEWFILLNICIPVIIGSVVYYLFFPDVLFVRMIDSIVGSGVHLEINISSRMAMIIRYYLFDVLWAYSLTCLITGIIGTDCPNRKLVLAGIILFETIMETIQLAPGINGTFDVCDIVVEAVVSILVINYFFRKGDRV